MTEKLGLTPAIIACKTDVIALLSFQNYFYATSVFLVNNRDAFNGFLAATLPVTPTHDPSRYRSAYHQDFLARHMVRASAEALLNYITDLLRVVLTARPEILRSTAQVRVEDVLRHSEMTGFVAWYAERQVNELAYKSLVDLDQYFTDRLGVPICDDPAVFTSVRRLVARRNLIVHGRGVVNELYRKAADEPEAIIGEPLSIDFDEAMGAPDLVDEVAASLDLRVATKFGF